MLSETALPRLHAVVGRCVAVHDHMCACLQMELRYNEVERAREIFELYVRCHPDVKAWVRYAKFEMKNSEIGLARAAYERAVEELGEDAQTVSHPMQGPLQIRLSRLPLSKPCVCLSYQIVAKMAVEALLVPSGTRWAIGLPPPERRHGPCFGSAECKHSGTNSFRGHCMMSPCVYFGM